MQSQYHLFSLPPDLLDTLIPRNSVYQSGTEAEPEPELDSQLLKNQVSQPPPLSSQACTICVVSFGGLQDQRAHFKSDWHRYNVKLRLGGSQAVTESEFATLIDALQDSLSGSESSSSDENGDSASDPDVVSTLLNKERKRSSRPQSPSSGPASSLPQTALAWFHSPPSTQIGVYRAIFDTGVPASDYLPHLKELQLNPPTGRKWAMFMTAGGHFAGAIARVSKDSTVEEEMSKRKQPKAQFDMEVIRHKTFHRYTTRRKQGGSQSVNDNAKGPAKSAGAQLRRYGEQALRDDIRGLLTDWAEDLHDCERIWIRANTANRRIFLDFDDTILSKKDERLRTFPFPTRRPTHAEVIRCLNELLRPKISHLTEEILQAQDLAYLASIKPKPQPPQPSKPQPNSKPPTKPKYTKEEEAIRDKWTKLIEMVQKNRVEALKTFWEKEGSTPVFGSINCEVPDLLPQEKRHTLLQVAALAGSDDVIRWLLDEMNADPTILVPSQERDQDSTIVEPVVDDQASGGAAAQKSSRRTAYDLATNKETRNVFRRCAAARPDAWDWLDAARVPSILTKDMEDEQDEKKKVKKKGLKERLKEREAKEKEKQALSAPKAESVVPQGVTVQKQVDRSGPQKLGGVSGASEGVAGLTPEMRAKIERERRARAAEARMKALGAR